MVSSLLSGPLSEKALCGRKDLASKRSLAEARTNTTSIFFFVCFCSCCWKQRSSSQMDGVLRSWGGGSRLSYYVVVRHVAIYTARTICVCMISTNKNKICLVRDKQ